MTWLNRAGVIVSRLSACLCGRRLPSGRQPLNIGETLRQSPEILSFLRCDTRLPDPLIQKMAEIVCASTLGK